MKMEEKINEINKIIKQENGIKLTIKLNQWFESNIKLGTLDKQMIIAILVHAEGSMAKINQNYTLRFLLTFILGIISTQMIFIIKNWTTALSGVTLFIIFLLTFFGLFVLYWDEKKMTYKSVVLKKITENYYREVIETEQ